MKKVLIYIAIVFSLLSFITVSAFSYFYFGDSSISIEAQGNAKIDDLKVNYQFAGEGNENNPYYSVYFFSQPDYATVEEPLNYNPETAEDGSPSGDYESNNDKFRCIAEGNTYTGYGGRYQGYYPSRKDNNKGTNGEGRFGYTLIYAYLSITDDQFQSVEDPKSDKEDTNTNWAWYISFSGYTYSQKAATTIGYMGQGNFSLFNNKRSLYYYDMIKEDGTIATDEEATVGNVKGIDGSYVGDNKLYLYPLFTSGKDYGTQTTNTQSSKYNKRLTALRTKIFRYEDGVDPTQSDQGFIETYGSTRQSENGNSYSEYQAIFAEMTNQRLISDNASNTPGGDSLTINISPVLNTQNWGGDWIRVGDPNNISSSFDETCNTNTALITQSGLYNVYVYCISSQNSSVISNYLSNGKPNTQAPLYTSVSEQMDPNHTNHLIDNIVKTGSAYQTSKSTAGGYYYYYEYWIERIYQYKVLGTTTSNLDYDSHGSINLFRSSSAEYKYLSQPLNIYSTLGTFTTSFTNIANNRDYIGSFSNSIFAISASKTGINYTVDVKDSTGPISVATPGVDFFIYDAQTGQEVDDTHYENNYKNRFLKFNKEGHYILHVSETYDSNHTNISSLTVEAVHYQYNPLITIVQDDPTDTDSSGLIETDEYGTVLYTSKETIDDTNSKTVTLTEDSTFTKNADNTTTTFAEIYKTLKDDGKCLKDHVTGRKISNPNDEIYTQPDPHSPYSINVLKAYVFYVADDV